MQGQFRSSRPVAMATEILMLLIEGAMPLTEIASACGTPKSTVHRILQDLASQRLVTDSDGRYALGPGCFRLLQALNTSTITFGFATRAAMQQLRDVTGETAVIHVRMGHTRVVVEEAPSHETVKYVAGVGAMSPIHLGSAGKVLLAFLPADEREALVRSLPLQEEVLGHHLGADELLAQLKEIRQLGYAESFGERIAGGAAISVPLLGLDGRVAASVSVLGPRARLPQERLLALEPVVREAVGRLRTSLWADAPSTSEEEGPRDVDG
jgi:DNA-binding IclR family transcriptional regulator